MSSIKNYMPYIEFQHNMVFHKKVYIPYIRNIDVEILHSVKICWKKLFSVSLILS